MRQLMLILFVTIVTTIYAGLAYYIYSRGAKVLEGCTILPTLKWVFWLLTATFFVGQMLERGDPGIIATTISRVGSVWLVFFFYMLLYVLFVDLFRVAQHLFHVFPLSLTSGILSGKMLLIYGVSIVSIVIFVGFINARNPIVKEVNIEIPKRGSSLETLRVVLVTDVHLGVILGRRHAEKLVRQINAQNPDIVLFGGDLVDHNPRPVIKQNMGKLFETIVAPLGVYAVTGNHEFIGHADISINYFTQHGVKYIRDSVITIDGKFQIVGRDDREKIRFVGDARKSIATILENNSANLPILLVDHQPVDYAIAAEHKVDLMMSGHTHKGQIWPFSHITNRLFENHFGLLKKGATWFYTSSGYGTWGPPIRTGNRPELVVFNITFK